MKKIFSCVLCLAMMLSIGITAFAADISTDGGSQEVTVTYGTSQGFVVSIPADIEIGEDGKGQAVVSASNVMIPYLTTLRVKVSGSWGYEVDDVEGSWILTDKADSNNMLGYTIGISGYGNHVVDDSTILAVRSGECHDSTKSTHLYFSMFSDVTKSGAYEDTLTFSVDIGGGALHTFDVTFLDSEYNPIETKQYQYENGMTWREWAVSEYNTDGFAVSIGGGGTVCPDSLTVTIDGVRYFNDIWDVPVGNIELYNS